MFKKVVAFPEFDEFVYKLDSAAPPHVGLRKCKNDFEGTFFFSHFVFQNLYIME